MRIWDNDGLKSVEVEEIDANYHTIRRIPSFPNYPNIDEFNNNENEIYLQLKRK